MGPPCKGQGRSIPAKALREKVPAGFEEWKQGQCGCNVRGKWDQVRQVDRTQIKPSLEFILSGVGSQERVPTWENIALFTVDKGPSCCCTSSMGVWYPAMQYPISASGENVLFIGFSVNTHKWHFIVYQAFLCTWFHLLLKNRKRLILL